MRIRIIFGIFILLIITSGILISQGITSYVVRDFCCYDDICLKAPDCIQPSTAIIPEQYFLGGAVFALVAVALLIRLRHHDE